MNLKRFYLKNFLFLLFFYFFGINCLAHISDYVFDDTQVHEFHLTFEQENFLELLQENYDNGSHEYISATFEFNNEIYENVGTRFKGGGSMNYPSWKKPFKIKFDAFIEDQEFYGLDKLSLSNGYNDPTQIREKIFADVVNKYIPGPRANFIKLFINGSYWGLYTNVEQINKRFLEKNFGDNEDGNLFKGDPIGHLVWLGEEQESYYNKYELKTNELENDWSDLIYLIDRINNTTLAEYPDEIEQVFHIHNFLYFIAITNMFVNFDSYIGHGHNYYIYHRNDTDKFIHIPWDFNFSFGLYNIGVPPASIYNTQIFFGEPPAFNRPLVNRTFAIDEYREIYLMIYQYLMDNEFREDIYYPIIDQWADLIREAVYDDSLKMFTNEQFEIGLEENIPVGIQTIVGLKPFITNRRDCLNIQLEAFDIPDRISGIYVNEFMADNIDFIADEHGDYDDWIEIYNSNEEPVNLAGYFITDDPSIPDKWKFPEAIIDPFDHQMIWADNNSEQGSFHANFKLNANGEFLGIYDKNGVLPLDTLSFGYQIGNNSSCRIPDGSFIWEISNQPTPGESNMGSTFIEDDLYNSITKISNYPNPFNSTTTISFNLTTEHMENTEIFIYNMKGQKVKQLGITNYELGINSAELDGKNEACKPVSSGIYFYKLRSGSETLTRKMILLR